MKPMVNFDLFFLKNLIFFFILFLNKFINTEIAAKKLKIDSTQEQPISSDKYLSSVHNIQPIQNLPPNSISPSQLVFFFFFSGFTTNYLNK